MRLKCRERDRVMKRGFGLMLTLAAAAGFVLAQDAPPQPDPGGWRRIGGNQAPALQTAPQTVPTTPAPPPPPSYSLPSTLTVKPGTFIIVRLNQLLSSDHNHQGDGFTATLEQPIVVDGIAVAQAGQLVAGEVTDAKVAHRGENVSHLGVALTNLTLADGNQVNIQSSLVTASGPGWGAPETATVAGTGAFGAAIGAIAGGGTGAAIGAGAGAFAALAGLLMTKGHPTVLSPEAVLTFRITNEVTVDMSRSPQSFGPPQHAQYSQGSQPNLIRRGPPPGYAAPYSAPAPGPYYGYPYPYAYAYPYAYGPSVVVGVGGYYRGPYGYGYGYYHH